MSSVHLDSVSSGLSNFLVTNVTKNSTTVKQKNSIKSDIEQKNFVYIMHSLLDLCIRRQFTKFNNCSYVN